MLRRAGTPSRYQYRGAVPDWNRACFVCRIVSSLSQGEIRHAFDAVSQIEEVASPGDNRAGCLGREQDRPEHGCEEEMTSERACTKDGSYP
jgi:hypothetical protein